MRVTFINKFPEKSEVTLALNRHLEGMTLSRHHVFSTYNKYQNEDPNKIAGNVLLDRLVTGDLEQTQYIGLDAELEFYHAFKAKLQLVPALDCGDHTDFIGMWEGKLIRFDVTTNLNKKKPQDYSYFENHIVVVYDAQSRSFEYYYAENGKFETVKTVNECIANTCKV